MLKILRFGQRVLVVPNQMTALIVGKPDTHRAKLVRDKKYENSTRYEYTINANIELLPTDEQYPAHGGTHVRQEGEF